MVKPLRGETQQFNVRLGEVAREQLVQLCAERGWGKRQVIEEALSAFHALVFASGAKLRDLPHDEGHDVGDPVDRFLRPVSDYDQPKLQRKAARKGSARKGKAEGEDQLERIERLRAERKGRERPLPSVRRRIEVPKPGWKK